jgi:HAD superfamily hydrolase (TIGR01509 family)
VRLGTPNAKLETRDWKLPLRAVLFDFEGTLVDFQWRLAEAEAELRAALEELGFALEPFSGDNYATLRTRAIGLRPELRTELDARFSAIYDRYDGDALGRWSVLPGAEKVLARLASRGLRLGLVTNIGRPTIGPALERLGLDGSFEVVVTRNEVAFAKPSGEGIRKALEFLACRAEETLFVGDSLSDLGAARDAGVAVAIVAGGESSAEAVRTRGPDHFLRRLLELDELLPPVLP